jgi:hypothetical protein
MQRQRLWVSAQPDKGRAQAAVRFNRAIRYPLQGLLNVQFAFFSAASTAALSGRIVPLSSVAHGVRSIRILE